MKKSMKEVCNIFIRYFIILLLSLNGFFIFYLVLTPLTIYPSFFLLSLFYDVGLQGDVFIIGNAYIQIINACIAGSAYFLLFALNMATDMKLNKRFKVLSFLFLSFLLLNVVRIVFLSHLFIVSNESFDFTHQFTWYFLSTIFIVVLWFASIKRYKIKEIPLYSDFKKLRKLLKI